MSSNLEILRQRGLIVTTDLSPTDLDALRGDAQVVTRIEAGDWSGLFEYLAEPGFTRPRESVTRNQFLLGIAPCALRIPALPEMLREGWKLILSIICAATEFDISSGVVQSLLQLGVKHGVVTQGEVDALVLQPCTRAEMLLGRAVQLTVDDLRAPLAHDFEEIAVP